MGTGWGLRRATFAENEDCALQGQFLPFPKTKADRIAAGDPRLSIEERYSNFWGYYYALLAAANSLVEKRHLLREDAQPLVQAALQNALTNNLLPKKGLASRDLIKYLQ